MNNWPIKKLGEILDYEQPTEYIVHSTHYSDDFDIPVLTAGKTFIKGYTNEKTGVFPKERLPVIIFDDFTTATKFVDFPFKVKSSAMKILSADKAVANIKYLFYVMQTLSIDHSTHKRYWISKYSKIEIPLPPIEVQNKIVKDLEDKLSKIKEVEKVNDSVRNDLENLRISYLHEAVSRLGE